MEMGTQEICQLEPGTFGPGTEPAKRCITLNFFQVKYLKPTIINCLHFVTHETLTFASIVLKYGQK